MIKLDNNELMDIKGGNIAYTATMINAICRVVDIIFEVGKNIGSSIRRSSENSVCPLK